MAAIEAKKHSYRQTQDGIVISFVLHPNDVPAELATAPLGTRYGMALVEITEANEDALSENKAEVGRAPGPQESQPGGVPPNSPAPKRWSDMPRAKQAGILCNDIEFMKWVVGDSILHHPAPAEHVAHVIRRRCCVQSRAELDTNQRAGETWDRIVTQFRDHQRYGSAA